MSLDPTPGRGRAPGPYSHDTRPPGRNRRHRADGPTLFDPPPDQGYMPPIVGAARLVAHLDGIAWEVTREVPEPGDGAARIFLLAAAGCKPFRVAELLDAAEDLGSTNPAHRGLDCSCGEFADRLDCGHLADLVALGLLRPSPEGGAR